jgi:hypothetical protein
METLYKSPRLHLARAGYIVFGYYTQVSDMEALAAAESAFKKVAKEHGRLVTVSYLSGRTVTQPVPDDVKVRATAILREVESELVTNVMVVAGEGIGVTILRAFMTAFFIFSKLKRPQKCVGDVASALAFIRTLDPKAGGGVTADAVEKFFGVHQAAAAARVA